VPLSDDQRREAVGLLAELLLDAALKREGVRSGSGFTGALDGVSGSVVLPVGERARARRAA